MSVISWGKCTIKHTSSTNGSPGSTWAALDTPKENTTKLSTSAGEEKKATEEGGAVIDRRFAKNTYQLEFDLFYKKNTTPPFQHDDGIVAGDHAFQVIPEDPNCIGIQIDKSVVRVEDTYSSEDGILIHVVVMALKPAQGNTVKYQVITSGGGGGGGGGG